MIVNDIDLEDVVKTLKRYVEDAQNDPTVSKPVSFALYHLWKMIDNRERRIKHD